MSPRATCGVTPAAPNTAHSSACAGAWPHPGLVPGERVHDRRLPTEGPATPAALHHPRLPEGRQAPQTQRHAVRCGEQGRVLENLGRGGGEARGRPHQLAHGEGDLGLQHSAYAGSLAYPAMWCVQVLVLVYITSTLHLH